MELTMMLKLTSGVILRYSWNEGAAVWADIMWKNSGGGPLRSAAIKLSGYCVGINVAFEPYFSGYSNTWLHWHWIYDTNNMIDGVEWIVPNYMNDGAAVDSAMPGPEINIGQQPL